MSNFRTKRPMANITKDRSRYFRFYASLAADVDLFNDGPQFDAASSSSTNVGTAEIHVFGGGNLVVQRLDGTNVTLASVPSGWVLPIEVGKLIFAGTTATNIMVLW